MGCGVYGGLAVLLVKENQQSFISTMAMNTLRFGIQCLKRRPWQGVVSRTYASRTMAGEPKNAHTASLQFRQALQSRDMVFYTAPPGVSRTFFYVYVSAGVQLLFWGNLASLAYISYAKKESEEEDAPVVLAPQGQRMAIAGGLLAIGIGIASVMFIYPWRYIDKIILLKGGAHVRILTHARFIESQKCKEYGIEQLSTSQLIHTGFGPNGTDAVGKNTSSHVFLRAKGERIGYMLDRKGRYTDSSLFDTLWSLWRAQ